MYRIIGDHGRLVPNLDGLVTGREPGVTRHAGAFVVPFRPSRRNPNPMFNAGGGVFSADGKRLAEANFEREPEVFFDPDESLAIPQATAMKAALYGGVLFDHYGHFLIESTARLWAVARGMGDGLPVIFIVPPNFVLRPYQSFLFDRLGVLDRLHLCREPLQIGELIVPAPSMRYVENCNADAAYLEPFQRIAAAVPERTRPRTYVSRRRLSAALAFPEGEVEDMFRAEGWDIVYPEDLAPEEQLDVFRNSRQLAGLSGSGMHNQVYARPGVQAVHINRFWAFYRTFFVIDELTGADSIHIHGNLPMEPRPFGASGPFFLDVARIGDDLRASGVFTRSHAMPDADRMAAYVLDYQGAAWLMHARHARGRKDEPARENAIAQGLATGRNTAEFLFEEALLHRDRGRPTEAVAALRRAIALDPGNTSLVHAFVTLARDGGDAAAVTEGVERLLAGDARDAATLAMVSQHLIALGRHAEALAVMDRDPAISDAATLARRAECYRVLGRPAEALAALQTAAALYPGNFHILNQLSAAWERGGDLDQAIDRARQASAAAPDNAGLAARLRDLEARRRAA